MKISVKKDRRPIHFYTNQFIYFITVRTINNILYFNTSQKKRIIVQQFNSVIKKFQASCYAWVVLGNHFHFLIKFKNKEDLPNFMRNLNGSISYKINQHDKIKGRKIIDNYWDYCVRNEADFWRHFNYIHNNPIKHRYVKNIKELSKYKFSSFNAWIKKKSEEWVYSCFEEYPILDFTVEHD